MVVGVVVGVVMGGVTGVAALAVSRKFVGAPVPAPAVKPTPCDTPTPRVRSHSSPPSTYCVPVWLMILAFQIESMERP